MSSDDLPPIEETWVQFKRICEHALFTKSANHQELLRELIERSYNGPKEFAAKVLADELFGRDTSIAKVEGRTVRNKLNDFYDGDGRNDPIVIRIPPRTFKPKITSAILPLAVLPGFMRLQALEFQIVPSRGAYQAALRTLVQALEYAPGHPFLTGTKALIHVQRAVYGEDPRVELEAAEFLVRDVYARNGVSWEAALANAALHTSRSRWDKAEEAFRQSASYYVERRPTNCSPWHLIFLASQRRFQEAIGIIKNLMQAYSERVCDLETEMAMMSILAGDLAEAEKVTNDARAFYKSDEFKACFPAVEAVLLAAQGKYSAAVNSINQQPTLASNSIIGSAGLGLVILFAGLEGDSAQAETAYHHLHEKRSRHSLESLSTQEDIRVPAFHVALAALGINKIDMAVKWLEIAVLQEREPLGLWIHILPFFRPLHNHAGFCALVSKMKLSLEA